MDDLLNQITGLTQSQRKKLFSWAGSLPEEKIVEIFQDSVKVFFQLKNDYKNLSGKIGKYCAFIVASRRSGWDTLTGKGYRVAEEKQYVDFSTLRKAHASVLINRGRTPVLRRRILAHWGEVRELKANGLGFRPIADYLTNKRKVKTSASYLARLWKELDTHD